MILEQGGITTEVTNPSDIALYKRRGWVEVKEVKQEPVEEAPVEPSPKKAVNDGKSTRN